MRFDDDGAKVRRPVGARRRARPALGPVLRTVALGAWLAAATGWLPGCPGMSDEELLAGKRCGAAGECLPGYVCDTRQNLCVAEGTPFGGSGGITTGGGSGVGGSVGGSGGAPPKKPNGQNCADPS